MSRPSGVQTRFHPRDMAAFDSLPPKLRLALNECIFPMAAEFAKQMLDRGIPEAQLIKMLEERMIELCSDGKMPPQEIKPLKPVRMYYDRIARTVERAFRKR